MEKEQRHHSEAFNRACLQILIEHPEAVGVAYKGLDCGCALICGVSPEGEPVGYLKRISTHSVQWGQKAPVCIKCRRDDGLKRVVREGISWPGPESELPARDFRLTIGRKVFGEAYREDE